ncbi:CBO0543 family protein [Halobacillus ihumii]|uniref:CBO0543 family protein n=1 Tax=Halobacillus ihumii TaxID=2686092 RepID=UPI003B835AE3
MWAVLAAWRWADWNLFRNFHATILYMSSMNLLYLLLTSDYRLWIEQSNLGLPHTLIALLYTFIVFPCTVMLFLSNYPDKLGSQILHIGKWIIIYIGTEWVGHLYGFVYYTHGWSLVWSLLFLIVMFPMLRLHHKRPILAYLISLIIIAFLLDWFDVPWKSL